MGYITFILKGSLLTVSKNKFILTIAYEYFRFPFAYPCAEQNTETVIACLNSHLSIFGMPFLIHSDSGAAFKVDVIREYLTEKGFAQSITTPNNHTGISQCEKFIGIIWKTVQLATKSGNFWDTVVGRSSPRRPSVTQNSSFNFNQ